MPQAEWASFARLLARRSQTIGVQPRSSGPGTNAPAVARSRFFLWRYPAFAGGGTGCACSSLFLRSTNGEVAVGAQAG